MSCRLAHLCHFAWRYCSPLLGKGFHSLWCCTVPVFSFGLRFQFHLRRHGRFRVGDPVSVLRLYRLLSSRTHLTERCFAAGLECVGVFDCVDINSMSDLICCMYPQDVEFLCMLATTATEHILGICSGSTLYASRACGWVVPSRRHSVTMGFVVASR